MRFTRIVLRLKLEADEVRLIFKAEVSTHKSFRDVPKHIFFRREITSYIPLFSFNK